MTRSLGLLTTTLFVGLGIGPSVQAQDRTAGASVRVGQPPAAEQIGPPRTVVTPPPIVEWPRFDPKAGTWQDWAPPPFAYPRPVRYPTTGVWFYPYPHLPTGQGVVDNH